MAAAPVNGPALDQTVAVWQGASATYRVPISNPDDTRPDLSRANAAWWAGPRPLGRGGIGFPLRPRSPRRGDQGPAARERWRRRWQAILTITTADLATFDPAGIYQHEIWIDDGVSGPAPCDDRRPPDPRHRQGLGRLTSPLPRRSHAPATPRGAGRPRLRPRRRRPCPPNPPRPCRSRSSSSAPRASPQPTAPGHGDDIIVGQSAATPYGCLIGGLTTSPASPRAGLSALLRDDPLRGAAD